MTKSEPITIINNMKIYDHYVLFYDTSENKRSFVYPYLADGLLKNRAVAYICYEESPESLREGLESYTESDKDELNDLLLIRRYDEWYIEKGRAEPIRIISKWNEAYKHFKEKGLGLRASGELACFIKMNMVRELLRYEYALHRILTIPMEALCVYNLHTIVNTGYTDIIMPIIRAHGKAIFTTDDGCIILEPSDVEDTDVEKLLNIEI